eukprot:scaffold4.g5021.t1
MQALHTALPRAGAPSAAHNQPCFSGRRAALPAPLPPRTARLAAAAARSGGTGGRKVSEADLYVAEPPVGRAPPLTGAQAPWYVVAPLALVGALAMLRVFKAVRRRFSGNSLSERGYKRAGGVADDRYYTRLMQGMKTVQYEELSDEAIKAARRRRQREVGRDTAPMNLDNIELPENHPFATKREVTKGESGQRVGRSEQGAGQAVGGKSAAGEGGEGDGAPQATAVRRDLQEEERLRARLGARRGLSAEDMALLRQQQRLAAEMDAAADAAAQA